MAKTQVSASTLSDAFARRMKTLFPTASVTGFDVEPLGDGKWQPRSYFDPMPDSLLAKASELVTEMQSQFELVDTK